MEKERKPDRRKERTRRELRNAFVRLASKKEIDRISVKELAEEANINRKTFYCHYSKVEDVLDEIETEVYSRAEAVIQKNLKLEPDMNPYPLYVSTENVLKDELEFFRCFFSTEASKRLMGKIKELFKKAGSELILARTDTDPKEAEFIMEYISSGVIALHTAWMKNDYGYSIEELSQLAERLLLNGVTGVIGQIPESPTKTTDSD